MSKQRMGELVDVRITAQLVHGRNLMASDYNYRTALRKRHSVSVEEIAEIEDRFVELIRATKDAGLDGVQLRIFSCVDQ